MGSGYCGLASKVVPSLCTCSSLSQGISLSPAPSAGTSSLSGPKLSEGCIVTDLGSSSTLFDRRQPSRRGSWAASAVFSTLAKEQEKVRLNKISS